MEVGWYPCTITASLLPPPSLTRYDCVGDCRCAISSASLNHGNLLEPQADSLSGPLHKQHLSKPIIGPFLSLPIDVKRILSICFSEAKAFSGAEMSYFDVGHFNKNTKYVDG